MKLKIAFIALCLFMLTIPNASAGLLGTYYNLSSSHPDMQNIITGWTPGMVESTLTGDAPTLTAYGATQVSQFDWWDDSYEAFSRVDSDADLQSNFASSWFPVNGGLNGDPYHFAVKWSGTFYVDSDKNYTYSMGSDDDSWLFIDGQLVLDLGGVHAMSYTNYDLFLDEGHHTIDIFFAERHTVESGFQLNFFSDLEPTSPVPEPATLFLLGGGLLGTALIRRRKHNK